MYHGILNFVQGKNVMFLRFLIKITEIENIQQKSLGIV